MPPAASRLTSTEAGASRLPSSGPSANGALLNDTESDFLESSAEDSADALRRRQLANRRLRRSLVAAAGLLVVALILLGVALISRHDAVVADASARSQALATESKAQVARDPQLALLLARAALASAATPAAELAASEALDANTLRAQLPSLGVQACASSDYLILLDGGHTAAADTCQGNVVFADLVHHRILRSVHIGPTATDMVLADGGNALIVASGRNLVSVDLASGHTRRLFTAPFEIEQLAGPPGHFLAIADRELIELVNLRRGTLHLVAHADASANGVNGMMAASPEHPPRRHDGRLAGRGRTPTQDDRAQRAHGGSLDGSARRAAPDRLGRLPARLAGWAHMVPDGFHDERRRPGTDCRDLGHRPAHAQCPLAGKRTRRLVFEPGAGLAGRTSGGRRLWQRRGRRARSGDGASRGARLEPQHDRLRRPGDRG